MTGLLAAIRRTRPAFETPAFLLLLGKITDAEYRQMLVAESQRFSLPKRGWTHRPARLRSLAGLFLAQAGAIGVLLFLLIAASLAGPVPR